MRIIITEKCKLKSGCMSISKENFQKPELAGTSRTKCWHQGSFGGVSLKLVSLLLSLKFVLIPSLKEYMLVTIYSVLNGIPFER